MGDCKSGATPDPPTGGKSNAPKPDGRIR